MRSRAISSPAAMAITAFSRQCIPRLRSHFERVYPFGWLGILVDVPPLPHELIYAHHSAVRLCSMRRPRAAAITCNVPRRRKVDEWSDDRFWDELRQPSGPGRRPEAS